MHITQPLLHKFSVGKQKLCKSTEVAFSCTLCPGYPKGWRTFRRTDAEFHKLPLIFCYIFILIFFITLCLKLASGWALLFAVLTSHLISTNISHPALWSLNGCNPLLYFLLVSCVLNSWTQTLYLEFQSSHWKSFKYTVDAEISVLGEVYKHPSPAALSQPEGMSTPHQ